MVLSEVLLILTTLLLALHAGLLFSFSVAVVPGLRASSVKSHLEVMNQINIKIENPLFLATFIGPLVLLPFLAYMHIGTAVFYLILAALILQLLFCYSVTILGNLPLNRKLAGVLQSSSVNTNFENMREDFQKPSSKWMQFHAIRTVASIVATLLLLITLTQL